MAGVPAPGALVGVDQSPDERSDQGEEADEDDINGKLMSQITRITMPVPVSPLIIEPTPGMKNDTSSDIAGFFAATAMGGPAG